MIIIPVLPKLVQSSRGGHLIVQSLVVRRFVKRFGERAAAVTGYTSVATGFTIFASAPTGFLFPFGMRSCSPSCSPLRSGRAGAVCRPGSTSTSAQRSSPRAP